MSTIASLALAIRARTERLKQDLSPALAEINRWGAAARAAGVDAKEVGREMARMRQEALKGSQGAAAATDNFRQRLQAAKQGAAALSGAVSVMSSEVGGAVGHVTRLGTSLTSAFLAGGPAALGVTALSAGIAAVAGASKGAAEEVKRAEDSIARLRVEGGKRIEDLAADVYRLRDAIAVLRGELSKEQAGDRSNQRAFEARETELEAQIEKERAAIRDWTGERDRLLAFKNEYAAAGRNVFGITDAEITKRDAWLKRAHENLMILKEEVALLKEKRGLEQEESSESSRKAEVQARVEAGLGPYAQERAERKARKAEHDAWVADMQRQRAEAKAQEDATLRAYDERVARQAEAERRELAQRMADAYGMEAQMEGDRVRARQAQEAAKAEQDSKQAAEASARAVKEAAAAAKEKLELEKQAVEVIREQNRLVAKRQDITKRFGNVGGSMFGFGAGQVGTGMGDIGGDAARAVRGAGPWSRNGGANQAAAIAGGKGLGVVEVAPHVKELEAEIAKIPGVFERLVGAVTSASATTKGVVVELGRATERAASALRRDVEALRADVHAQAKAIERAGAGTGAGD